MSTWLLNYLKFLAQVFTIVFTMFFTMVVITIIISVLREHSYQISDESILIIPLIILFVFAPIYFYNKG